MSTCDFITALFCRIDDGMGDVSNHPQAKLYPSKLVTIAVLMAMKGGSTRHFYHFTAGLPEITCLCFLTCPTEPDRTRLLRRLATRRVREWADRFLAEPTFFGLVDSCG